MSNYKIQKLLSQISSLYHVYNNLLESFNGIINIILKNIVVQISIVSTAILY